MDAIQLGDRVLVDGRPGVVRYAGETEFCSGFWYGIELDKREGFNDGSVEGKRYFDLQDKRGNYGIFAQLEDLTKIDECDALKDENRRLTSLVRALERKIRQLHLKRSQFNVPDVQETVRSSQERAQGQTGNARVAEQIASLKVENRQLHASIKSLRAGAHDASKKKDDLRKTDAQDIVFETDQDDTKDLRDENDRLSQALKVAIKDLDESKEENRQHEALHDVYVEIEAELRDQLSILENFISKEKGTTRCNSTDSSISKGDITKAMLFEELCTTLFPITNPSLHLMHLQCDFLQKSFASGRLVLSLQDELTGQLYFSVLRELTNEGDNSSSSTDFDVLQREFALNVEIVGRLLVGDITVLRFPNLIQLLKDSPCGGSNSKVLIPLLPFIFGELLPQILVFHRKSTTSKQFLTVISSLYSVSLLIEELARDIHEKIKLDPRSTIVCGLHLSRVLEITLSMVRNEPEPDWKSFEDFKPTLEEILETLRLSEIIHAPPEQDSKPDADVSCTNLNTETDHATIARLKSELSDKDSRTHELVVKTQLLERKLEECLTQQAATVQREDKKLNLTEKSASKEEELDPHGHQPHVTEFDMNGSLSRSQLKFLNKESINSEIADLQRVVASLTRHKEKEPPNFSWLYGDRINLKPFPTATHADFANKLNDLTNGALEVTNYTKIVKYQNEPLDTPKNYITNATFKQRVLNSKIKDISI